MFSYYGSKSKVVHLYPKPKFNKIIEPFAGSARYALRYFDRDVLLVDKYEVIVRIWKWLQQASPKDILSLPKLQKGESVPASLSEDERNFLGFVVVGGAAHPQYKVATFDGVNVERDLSRIAGELYKIKHWKIMYGDYTDIENQEATWFIDPPYQVGGEHYSKNNKVIDYQALAKWCTSRKGQIIVCENTKADWLPFYAMREMNGQMFTTTEAIWSNYPHNFMARQPELFPA